MSKHAQFYFTETLCYCYMKTQNLGDAKAQDTLKC